MKRARINKKSHYRPFDADMWESIECFYYFPIHISRIMYVFRSIGLFFYIPRKNETDKFSEFQITILL